MKAVFFMILAALAFTNAEDEHVEVLQDTRENPIGAAYKYLIELNNGIQFQETGSEGSLGQSVASGTYRFETPEGELVEVTYTADENGFQAQSDAIPKMPEHSRQQVEFAAGQKAAGVQYDERGFQL